MANETEGPPRQPARKVMSFRARQNAFDLIDGLVTRAKTREPNSNFEGSDIHRALLVELARDTNLQQRVVARAIEVKRA